MDVKTQLLLPLLCGWTICSAPVAVAEDAAARGWYIGLSAGSANAKAGDFARAQSWNYDAGYRFANLSSELTYSYLGRFRHDDAAATDVRVWNVTLAAVPHYEVNSWFALEALLGVHRWRADAQLLGMRFGSDDGIDATYGVGARVQIKWGAALTVRWQRYSDVSGADIDQYAMGVQYVFR